MITHNGAKYLLLRVGVSSDLYNDSHLLTTRQHSAARLANERQRLRSDIIEVIRGLNCLGSAAVAEQLRFFTTHSESYAPEKDGFQSVVWQSVDPRGRVGQ